MGKESFFPTIEEVMGKEINPQVILSEQIYYIERLSHKIYAMLKEDGNMFTLCVGMKGSPFMVPIIAYKPNGFNAYPGKAYSLKETQAIDNTEQFNHFAREIFHSELCMRLMHRMIEGD